MSGQPGYQSVISSPARELGPSLAGTPLVISDAHPGVVDAIASTLTGRAGSDAAPTTCAPVDQGPKVGAVHGRHARAHDLRAARRGIGMGPARPGRRAAHGAVPRRRRTKSCRTTHEADAVTVAYTTTRDVTPIARVLSSRSCQRHCWMTDFSQMKRGVSVTPTACHVHRPPTGMPSSGAGALRQQRAHPRPDEPLCD